MDKCKWVEKNKAGEVKKSCGLMAQANSAFCPRHTFLHNITEQQRRDKEANKAEAERAGVAIGSGPATREQMLKRGYEFRGSGDCSGCGLHIEWWRTPNGRMAPYDPMPHLESFAKSHFATCTKRAEFRRAS